MSDDLDGRFEARNVGGEGRKLCVRRLSFEQLQLQQRIQRRRRRRGSFENDKQDVEEGEVEDASGCVDVVDRRTSVAKAKASDIERFDYQFQDKGMESPRFCPCRGL